jgi:hypothetical protein
MKIVRFISFYNISPLIVAPLRRQAGPVASHHSVYSSFDLRPSRNVFFAEHPSDVLMSVVKTQPKMDEIKSCVQ